MGVIATARVLASEATCIGSMTLRTGYHYIRGDIPYETIMPDRFGKELIVILPGYGAFISEYYFALHRALQSHERHVARISYGASHVFRHYEETARLVEHEIAHLQVRLRPSRTVIIGHSYGGVLGLLTGITENGIGIDGVIALGTPFTGGVAWPALKQTIRYWTGLSEELFPLLRDSILAFSSKLINISSRHDTTAPTTHCMIPNSRGEHIEVSEVLPREHIGHFDFITHEGIHALVDKALSY